MVYFLLAGVFSLAPLLIYLVWLSYVTRREKPTVLTGPWDFAALLGGLSGFILFGGGLLLILLQSNAPVTPRGNSEALRDAWEKEYLLWVLTIILYLLFVLGGSFLTLSNRRKTLVIYNVDPDAFEHALADVFERLGKPVERRGRLLIGGMPYCEVDPFEGGRTVVLRWIAEDNALFQDVERNLRNELKALAPAEDPAARWISTGVVAVGAVLVFLAFVVVYLRRTL